MLGMNEYKVRWVTESPSWWGDSKVERKIVASSPKEAAKAFIESEPDAGLDAEVEVWKGLQMLSEYYKVSDLVTEFAEKDWRKENPTSIAELSLQRLDEIHLRLKYIHWALLGGFGFIILCALGVIKIGFVGTWWAY